MLAPFDMNDYRHGEYNPDATWDRWELRAAGALPLKDGYATDPRVVWLEQRHSDAVAVIAPKESVDVDAIRGAARDHSAGAWDAWTEISRAHPGALPRPHFDALYGDRGEAETAYLLQPAVQAVAQAAATQQHPYFSFNLLLSDPVAQFSGDRETYLTEAAAEALATHAYVTLDGQWLTEYTGDRGWDAHVLALAEYLDTLPDDVMIARVHCHY